LTRLTKVIEKNKQNTTKLSCFVCLAENSAWDTTVAMEAACAFKFKIQKKKAEQKRKGSFFLLPKKPKTF